MYLEQLIIALGIPTCSKSTAAILVENFGTWDKIVKVTPSDLQKLPGFAETSSISVCEGIAEVADMAAELLKVITLKEKKTGPLTGMSFCVTGSLANMGRKEFYEFVVEKGGIAKNSVAEGLNYLVTNDTSSGSSKNQKAKKYGVKIINEGHFFNLAGDEPVCKKVEDKEVGKKDTVKVVSENLFG
jgi:DNA ligase (NAD+)